MTYNGHIAFLRRPGRPKNPANGVWSPGFVQSPKSKHKVLHVHDYPPSGRATCRARQQGHRKAFVVHSFGFYNPDGTWNSPSDACNWVPRAPSLLTPFSFFQGPVRGLAGCLRSKPHLEFLESISGPFVENPSVRSRNFGTSFTIEKP